MWNKLVPAYVWSQPKKKRKKKAYVSNEMVRMGAFNIASSALCNEIVANEIVWIGSSAFELLFWWMPHAILHVCGPCKRHAKCNELLIGIWGFLTFTHGFSTFHEECINPKNFVHIFDLATLTPYTNTGFWHIFTCAHCFFGKTFFIATNKH
jgi:hypothetical protein